jgi:ABC-2 type transport system permease protein
MGIFLATVARSMPQFGLLLMLTLMPLQMLSGGTTPRESMPVSCRTSCWPRPPPTSPS